MVSKTHKIIIDSSIESCFKVPIYCDVKDIMTGYGPLPPSEGVIQDDSWANPKGSRTVLAFGKPLCIEKIIEREENKYWKYELIDFQQSTFFFVKRVIGEIVVKNILIFTQKQQFLAARVGTHRDALGDNGHRAPFRHTRRW